MAAARALTVVSMILLVIGVVLVAWSIAPAQEGFDTPKTALDKTMTGPAGDDFGKTPFANLSEPGGRYRLELTSASDFVVGMQRADRPDDAIRQEGALATTAGGAPNFYYSKEWQSTIRSDTPSSPEAGPMVFFIKFPDATVAASQFHATATFTPTWSEPFIFLKAWSSLAGLVIAAIGLLLFLVRAGLPMRRAES